MKKSLKKIFSFENWIKRFVLAIVAVFLYWANESFIGLSIHKPTCLIIIAYFFIGFTIIDIILLKFLN